MFNDKYPNTDPVTGDRLTPTHSIRTTQGFSVRRASRCRR